VAAVAAVAVVVAALAVEPELAVAVERAPAAVGEWAARNLVVVVPNPLGTATIATFVSTAG
jgi:hypothetical protein